MLSALQLSGSFWFPSLPSLSSEGWITKQGYEISLNIFFKDTTGTCGCFYCILFMVFNKTLPGILMTVSLCCHWHHDKLHDPPLLLANRLRWASHNGCDGVSPLKKPAKHPQVDPVSTWLRLIAPSWCCRSKVEVDILSELCHSRPVWTCLVWDNFLPCRFPVCFCESPHFSVYHSRQKLFVSIGYKCFLCWLSLEWHKWVGLWILVR